MRRASIPTWKMTTLPRQSRTASAARTREAFTFRPGNTPSSSSTPTTAEKSIMFPLFKSPLPLTTLPVTAGTCPPRACVGCHPNVTMLEYPPSGRGADVRCAETLSSRMPPVLPAVWDDVIAWVRTTTSINRRQLGKKSRYGSDRLNIGPQDKDAENDEPLEREKSVRIE